MSTMWAAVTVLAVISVPFVMAALFTAFDRYLAWLERRREQRACPICPHGTVLLSEYQRRSWCRYHRERWYRIHSLERAALSDDGTLPWHAQTGLS